MGYDKPIRGVATVEAIYGYHNLQVMAMIAGLSLTREVYTGGVPQCPGALW
jgi:hypothetical protein